MGNRNRAFYRVVAADGRTATSGRTVEELGWYDPRKDGVNFKLDLPRVNYWADNGALLSCTVKNLIKRAEKLPVSEPAPAAAVADAKAATEAPGSVASAVAGDAAESGTA